MNYALQEYASLLADTFVLFVLTCSLVAFHEQINLRMVLPCMYFISLL